MVGVLLVAGCPDEPAVADAGLKDAAALDKGSPDRDVPAECNYGALGEQQLGEGCGCLEDCAAPAELCQRDLAGDPLGEPFCTIGCRNDRGCPENFGCTDPGLLGGESFCRRCAAAEPGTLPLGERCLCDSDCARAPVDLRLRPSACIDDACRISPCEDSGAWTCPQGQSCERRGLDGSACIPCLQRHPAGQFADCSCLADCQFGLQCIGGSCRKPCNDAEDCAAGQECREQALGGGLCAELDESCEGLGDHLMGDTCACNADCSEEAPTCLTLELGFFPLTMCSLRPCDPLSSTPCPEGSGGVARCCLIPTVLPATCLPPNLAGVVSNVALCSE